MYNQLSRGRLPPHNLQQQLEDGRLTGGRGDYAPAFFLADAVRRGIIVKQGEIPYCNA
jgi:hypothetical protein